MRSNSGSVYNGSGTAAHHMLPMFLQTADNSREISCYKIAVRMAMQQYLSPDQRKILNAIYLQGKSKSQLGRELGVSPAAISKRVQNIHRKLRGPVEFTLQVYKAMGEAEWE